MSIKDTAKTIVCYGDSNTWGSVPRKSGVHNRYPRGIRWPSALQNLLGDDFDVVSEGLSARTLTAKDPAKPWRTGITHLASILQTNEPVYLIVIMLGTNDAKKIYNLSAQDIAKNLEQTIDFIKKEDSKIKILVVCPAKPVTPSDGNIDPRMKRAPEIFEELSGLFKEVAGKSGSMYMSAGDYVTSSKVDGYHLDAESHTKLAEAIRDVVVNTFKS